MDFTGKKALILGLANERSIAYGIAKALKNGGAELGFTYIPVVEKRVRPIADELGASLITECDVSLDAQLEALSKTVQDQWGSCDILIHSVAYAEKEDLEKAFVETSRQGFAKAMDVSAYSLVACCRALKPLLVNSKASVICLSYYGAEKVVKNYNVMGVAKAALEACVRYLAADLGEFGVRVNAISAGPIRTLAASGVKDFKSILSTIEEKAPLKRNVDIDQIGKCAAFLASEDSGAITGETIYADSGFHIMGIC